MNDLVIGMTYSREELNKILGAPEGCNCRIVYDGHVCDDNPEGEDE